MTKSCQVKQCLMPIFSSHPKPPHHDKNVTFGIVPKGVPKSHKIGFKNNPVMKMHSNHS